ncbi:MAG: histidine kinase dimerization/phospho-acceptor domain-containing protein, partial [Halobacteria archaeon]|nr:histidine kinase dimerization/phospho-acceptor domain-containing protein [Halobacteria archaeon]
TGVIVLDKDGEIVDINSKAREILGYDGQIFGKTLLELLESDSALEGYTALVERYEGEEEIRDELTIRRDGHVNHYDVRVSPIFDPRDYLMGHMVLVTDITERKKREQELELQNRRLDDFASLVSHDLRNPLNVAQGYTEMAREEEDDEEYLERIEESHDRIEDIIQDALALARQGRRVEETELVALDEVVQDAWENVETHDTKLVNDANVTIETDRDRLLQVFENLFRNAVEHGSDDSVTVTVRVGATENAFYVEDDGEGI